MTYATHADLLRRFPWLARLPPPNAARVKKRQQRSLTSVKNTAATFMAKGAFRWNCDCFQLRTRRWDNREWKQPGTAFIVERLCCDVKIGARGFNLLRNWRVVLSQHLFTLNTLSFVWVRIWLGADVGPLCLPSHFNPLLPTVF